MNPPLDQPLDVCAPYADARVPIGDAEAAALVSSVPLTRNPIALRDFPGPRALAGLDLPAMLGGSGWSASAMTRIFRTAGRRDAELRDLIGAGHAGMLRFVPGRRFEPLLRDVASGRAYCAIAITEPDAGSDMQALATRATPSGDGYALTGAKQYIARIAECTHLIVFACVDRRAGPTLLSAFLVERHTPGLALEAMSPMGLANVSWGRAVLSDVRVSRSMRIGGEGQAMLLFRRHFAYWRTMMAAVAIGSGQAIVDRTVARMKSRHAFGGSIGRFSHLQQALAQHVAQLRMASLLIDRVAADIDGHRVPVFDAAMAKAEAVEAALAAAQWAMATFGAAGYDTSEGLEKRYRDLLGLRIADGTTDVLRGQVARAVLGERVYAESLHRALPAGFEDDAPLRQFFDE